MITAEYTRLPGCTFPLIATNRLPLEWYAVYTRSRCEKRVHEQFERRSIESLLPVYEAVHQWTDRKVQVQLPLFPGYVFVRVSLRDHLQVVQVPGVVKLVGFNGAPTALPQKDVDALRSSLMSGVRVVPHPYLTAGRRVRVKTGPLAGLTGILVRRKNKARFILSLGLIHRAIAVEVNETALEPER